MDPPEQPLRPRAVKKSLVPTQGLPLRNRHFPPDVERRLLAVAAGGVMRSIRVISGQAGGDAAGSQEMSRKQVEVVRTEWPALLYKEGTQRRRIL